MAGDSLGHNQIVTNLMIETGVALKNKECRIYSNDMRIWIKIKLFTYPDIIGFR